MTGTMKAYRLADCEITEQYGELWWKAHAGFASIRRGRCFIEGNILFLSPHCEVDEANLLKNEFLMHLIKLPRWEKTKYYCNRFEIHECGTASLPRKNRPPRIAAPADESARHTDVKPHDAPDKVSDLPDEPEDDFDCYLKNQSTSLPEIGMALAGGFESIKSALKRVKFWK